MESRFIEESSISITNFYWQRQATSFRKRAMHRPFHGQSKNRILIVSLPGRIPQSQVFPFHYFAKDFKIMYDAEFREIDLYDLMNGKSTITGNATTVAVQTPFDISDTDLSTVFERLQNGNPNAKLVYLDWCAPTDLRNAHRIDQNIDFYIKKHVLRDRTLYGKPTLGDTNLTDHYKKHFGFPGSEITHPIPKDFNRKIIVGPSFCTAPSILHNFLKKVAPRRTRSYDLHARFDVEGADWYQAMRCEASDAVDKISKISTLKGFGVGLHSFIRELRQSKICFSPFGYGEVCWRDFEAVMSGTVLLKPDMSHIETSPNVFHPWETYVPIRWDLSDLPEVLGQLLSDEKLRQRISEQAFSVLHNFVTSDSFARGMHRIMV